MKVTSRSIVRLFLIITPMLLTGSLRAITKEAGNEWIYYSSNQTGSQEVYRVRLTGTDIQQLTFDSEEDYFQSVSPDGKWLIFQSIEGEDFFLYRANLATLQTEQLTYVDSRFESWSPDGKSFIYTVFTEAGSSLWRLDWQDLSTHPVLERNHRFPHWSPDGQWIAFDLEEEKNVYNIYRITPEGENLTTVTSFEGSSRTVLQDWSPDGQWLIFGARDPQQDYHLYRIRSDGSELLQLTYQSNIQNYREWLSDNWIIFSQDSREQRLIFRVSSDGSNIQQLSVGGYDNFIGVTSRGKWLYWSGNREWGHLYEIDSETLNSAQLTTLEVGFPEMSPNKEWVVFRLHSNSNALFVSRIYDFEPRQLITGDGYSHFQYWQQ